MKRFVNAMLKPFIHWAYPEFKRQKGYSTYGRIFKEYFIIQKIVGFSRRVPWPVHFTSTIRGWEYIEKGNMLRPL